MKFHDIPAEIFTLRMFQPLGSTKNIKEGSVTHVAQSNISDGEYELVVPGGLVLARPVEERKASELNRELATGSSYLARIADVDEHGGFSLEIAFFSRATLEIGREQDIGVDEYVLNGMRKIKGFRDRSLDDRFFENLNKEFCFKQGEDYYFFVLAGAAIENEIDEFNAFIAGDEQEIVADSIDSELIGIPEKHSGLRPNANNSFCVVSRHASFVATEKPLPGGKSVYVATKLHQRSNVPDRALRLAHGKLNFVDWTRAGQVQLLAKCQLAEITNQDSSYLKTWDSFGNIEGEILLREAREFGVIHYINAIDNRDRTTTVTIVQATPTAYGELASNKVEGLEKVNEVPYYIENENVSFSEFSRSLSKTTWKQPDYYRVTGYDEASRQITLDAEHLQESGKLILSLQGDITQIRRRNSARRAIQEGRSANPQLGILLEESGVVTSLRQPKKVQALNAFVRKKVFKNDPTYMQEKAIEVALNTPDIALIQGPPGTGKTTVIAAIVERLNQESVKQGNDAKGQVLLTGFQHDAVENMIDRISLNSIPVPKIGKRSGQTEDDISAFERSLDRWCAQIVDNIRERYPDLDKSDQTRELDILAAQYVMAPTQNLAVKLVGMIAEASTGLLDSDLTVEAERLLRKLEVRSTLSSEDGSKYLHAVRVIRTTEKAFNDDGPDRADDALYELAEMLDPGEDELLRQAASWVQSKGTPPFLSELKMLKEKLLLRLSTPPVFRVEKVNQDVADLILRFKEQVKKMACTNKDLRMAALSEFVSDLEGNNLTVVDAVSEYSFAFAATCQQSAGQKMQSLKGIARDNDSEGLVYEYVIVDEAARVSPRDLMVPMAQGKRIILVGDHRQLPHIIDEEVATQMEEDGKEANELEWLKKSMFEYLFTERLKSLERSDGITRRVTLDKQFRMHPTLGDFISRNFYERFDPEERVASGLPASMFSHNLPLTDNKPVAWLEVPASKGLHTRQGTSWIRQAEIDAIANQLFEWMNSDAGKGSASGKPLTFGVISFYKAQALGIERALKRLGADEDRIRVGTVDSFQGMEFDVVFLSVVRTAPPELVQHLENASSAHAASKDPTKPLPEASANNMDTASFPQKRRSLLSSFKKALFGDSGNAEDNPTAQNVNEAANLNFRAESTTVPSPEFSEEEQREARKLFGHLSLYNRLNVSMSRQKRLLVVVGDSNLIRTRLADKFVPGLVDFYRLCESEGVILSCKE